MRMNDFPDFEKMGGAINVLSTEEEGVLLNKSFRRIFNNIEKEITHSWDSQFNYTILKNGGLGIVPCKNLIQNIGAIGTHSIGKTKYTEMIAEEMSEIIRHPKFVIINKGYEYLHFNNHIKKIYRKRSLAERAIKKGFRILNEEIKRILKNEKN
jgi:hypothetical protein